MGRFATALLLTALAAGPDVFGIDPSPSTAAARAGGQLNKADFVLRASPRMGMAQPRDLGWCLPVLLTAEIRGPETEELYCPKVEWRWPNDTVSAQESDCPPFEARDSCLEPQTGCGVTGWHRLPDGSVVETVKECPCTIMGYPRLWTQRVCLPKVIDGENRWEIEVRLLRDGKTLRKADVVVTVH